MNRKIMHKRIRFYLFRLRRQKLYFFLTPFFLTPVVALVFFILILRLNDVSVPAERRNISDNRHITKDTAKVVRGGCLPYNKACLIMQ